MIKFGSIRIYGGNSQRNKFNNLKKQAKQRFYDNVNEHLDDLKTVNSKMYWKTIHMLLKMTALRMSYLHSMIHSIILICHMMPLRNPMFWTNIFARLPSWTTMMPCRLARFSWQMWKYYIPSYRYWTRSNRYVMYS